MLKTEHNTPAMASRILAAFEVSDHAQYHETLTADYEHGQHWINCTGCGASWSVVDSEGGPTIDGFDFEEIAEGDESCTAEAWDGEE